jgi:RimJ/RimL family protein N-acetyltransferase
VETARLPLRWEVHAPRVPLERLAQLMAPFSSLINQQPLGELEMPPIRYELAAFESWYRELDLRGGEHYLIVLNDGDQVAAVCDANWDARVPHRVHQSFTAVAPAWRGRGVAKAVKAAMLLLVRERRPEVTTFTTHNAQANGPMLAINERLGFRVHREECTYQLSRDALGAYLARAASNSD